MKLSKSVLLSGMMLVAGMSVVNAQATEDEWESGNNFNYVQLADRRARTLNLSAEELTDNQDPRLSQNIISVVETEIRDHQSTAVTSQIGTLTDSILNWSSRKIGVYMGSVSRAAAAQPSWVINSDAVTDPANLKRVTLVGSFNSTSFQDPNLDPGYNGGGTNHFPAFLSGLADQTIAGYFFNVLDADSVKQATKPVVRDQASGLVVQLENGIRTAGEKGVFAGDMVGLDLYMNSAKAASGTDSTQMRSYTGVRVNPPLQGVDSNANHVIDGSELTPGVENFDQKSYGIRIGGLKANSTDNPDPTGMKYVGIRTEASLEVGEKLVYDPVIPQGEYVWGTSFQIKPNRPLVVLYTSSNYTLSNPLPAGQPGQQLQIIVRSYNNSKLTFQDSGNLALSGNRVLGPYDVLQLVYLGDYDNKWVEVGFTDN